MNILDKEDKLQEIKENLYKEYYNPNLTGDRRLSIEIEFGNVNKELTKLYLGNTAK